MTKLLYLVSHPIQYQAPLLRRLALESDVRLRVIFASVAAAGLHREPDFGQEVRWDVPLLDGYDYAELPSVDLSTEIAAADVIWVHGWQYSWQRRAIAEAFRSGMPVLLRGENWFGAMPEPSPPLRWLKRAWRRQLFSRCRGFLSIGSQNRDYYRAHGIDEDRLFSMPYAIDNDYFMSRAATADRAALRGRLGLHADQRVILFVGKLTSRKRPDLLLAAWRQAWPPGERPALIFAGDGELRASLEREATGALFVGFCNQSELPAYYALADVLVVPSEREPWGLVVNEAMACGTAVVASDQVGAAHDLIGPDCGAMFAAGDSGQLAAALLGTLPRAEALGRGAQRRIAGWDFAADIRGLRRAVDVVTR